MGLEEFQAKLHIYKRRAGLSQEGLGELVGFPPSTFSRRLSGSSGVLSEREVSAIIRVLAEHKGLATYQEANELLRLLHPGATLLEKGWKEGELSPVANAAKAKLVKQSVVVKNRVKPKLALTTTSSLPALPARTQPALVGQEQEIAQLIELLTYPDIRMVTLKGTGGIGKTSLGIEVLHRLAIHNTDKPNFPDGIIFIDLSEATNTGLLITAMLEAVGIKQSASGSEVSPGEALVNWLAGKSMLIMLDNFEQLLAVSVGSGELEENPRLFLSNLLNLVPGIKLLVTSRERLRIQGEQVFEVELLGYPALETEVTASESEVKTLLEKYPAVKLFAELAKSSDKDFKLTAENARDVCQICYYLDGLPFSIGLAASRADEFSPEVMLAGYLYRTCGLQPSS